jgi:hypothetical protein
MAVLLDSGFLFASLNASEEEHKTTILVLKNIREPIVLPVPAITEDAYLLARDNRSEASHSRYDGSRKNPLETHYSHLGRWVNYTV